MLTGDQLRESLDSQNWDGQPIIPPEEKDGYIRATIGHEHVDTSELALNRRFPKRPSFRFAAKKYYYDIPLSSLEAGLRAKITYYQTESNLLEKLKPDEELDDEKERAGRIEQICALKRYTTPERFALFLFGVWGMNRHNLEREHGLTVE